VVKHIASLPDSVKGAADLAELAQAIRHEFEAIDTVLDQAVEQVARIYDEAERTALDHAVAAGKKLKQARDRVGRGFRNWLAEHALKKTRAYDCILLADHEAEVSGAGHFRSIRAALKALRARPNTTDNQNSAKVEATVMAETSSRRDRQRVGDDDPPPNPFAALTKMDDSEIAAKMVAAFGMARAQRVINELEALMPWSLKAGAPDKPFKKSFDMDEADFRGVGIDPRGSRSRH
jgi:hypothetical protein